MGLRKLDGTAKVPRTLDRCRRCRGDLGGATQPFDGLLANLERLRFVRPLRAGNTGRFAVMKGDQFGHRILPLAGQALEPFGRRRMQPPTLGASQGLVGDLPYQDVAEGKDIAPRQTKEILLDQLLDDVVHVDDGRFQGQETRRTEGAPEYRAQLDDAALFRAELVEARQHGGLNGIR